MFKNIVFIMFMVSSLQGMQTKEHIILARNLSYIAKYLGYIERYYGLQFDTEIQPIDRVLFALAETENHISIPTTQLIIDKALQAGADIEAKSAKGQTPLIKAAIYNSTPVLKALCNAGANMNVIDSFGYTALDHAAARGHAQAIMELIDSGINVNTINAYQTTPLIYAIIQAQRTCIIALLQHGADPTIPDENGTTALDYVELVYKYLKEDVEIKTLLDNAKSKI